MEPNNNTPQIPIAKKPDDLFLEIVSEDLVERTERNEGPKSLYNMANDFLIDLSNVSMRDKLLFFQLLSAMIGAGVPIIEGLDLLHSQMKNPKLKLVIEDMRAQIEEGKSLAQSMRANKDVFDEATCAVVEAGEKSGKLNNVMRELVNQQEQLNTITKKIKGVMTYPIIVIIVMILLGVVVLLFVIPKLSSIFGGAENLPLPTRIMIGMSDFLQNNMIKIVILLFFAFFGFRQWKKSRNGAKQWSMILLSIPHIGTILRQLILTRVTRIFGFLIASGVPIVESLKIASQIAENELYKEKLLLAADDISKGISIAENLSDSEKLFPPMLINMIAIGEKSASLDVVMEKAADFYHEELEQKVNTLSQALEPIILGVIASGAVFMMLAIYLPILQMNDQIIGS
jgi:type IV pilus assembly protein PilC